MIQLINDITQDCEYSKGGITDLWLTNWYEGFELIINESEPNYVSGFSASVGFINVDCERTIVNIENVNETFANVYNNRFTISFTQHDAPFVEKIKELTKSRFVIIYKDANGRYWLSGFDRGYMILENIHRTEVFGGRNAYGLVFTSQSRKPDKEINSLSNIITTIISNPQCGDYYDTIVSDDIPLSFIADCIIEDFD
jgi:hypothetical protein